MITETVAGKVQGTTNDGISAFLGIPYAGPTLFGAPEPPAGWDGVRECTTMGATAPQPPYEPPYDALLINPLIPGPEFLNVNVWTPGGAGLPVMVYLPGGAFRNGSNASPVYDGRAFARDGVVLVSVNYRLGVPGFAVLADAPDNRGLLDQLAALRWVQENITAFGGDPGNVTVFGESAGGMSVAHLLALPAAGGLFQRAIMQSGNASAVADASEAAGLAAWVADRVGTEPTAAAFEQVGIDDLIAAQRALALDLRQNPDPAKWGRSVVAGGRGIMSFYPVIDGELITRPPLEGLAAGVELLAGTTREEFRLFTVPTGVAAAISAEALPAVVARNGWDPAIATTYAANRPDATPGDVMTDILTDGFFRIPTIQVAEAHQGSTYVYEFGWRSQVPGFGACHALELPFVFDTLGTADPITGPEPPQQLADRMHGAWVRFATYGDPGWAAYDTKTRSVMTFDHPGSVEIEDPRGDERLLWSSAP